MKRLAIYVTDLEHEHLRWRAFKLRTTMSQIVRDAITKLGPLSPDEDALLGEEVFRFTGPLEVDKP